MKGPIHSDPEILSGTPVFVGTRVPVQSLFDYLEGGETLDEFLRQFPSVRREQAIAAIELARDSVLAGARPTWRESPSRLRGTPGRPRGRYRRGLRLDGG